jgi:pyruvate dehydrogenase E2 component (dihydrolipoamide acetyltransferase)
MAISIVMPALEMAQETGKVVQWRKKEGEHVKKGELLLDVETDKAVVEIESPGEGILAGITAQPDAVVPVGKTIAWLLKPGEQPPTETTDTQTGRRTDGDAAVAAAQPASAAPPSAAASGRMSPKARRLAREHGIDVSRVRGTGPDGEILATDIQALVDTQKAGAVSVVAQGFSPAASSAVAQGFSPAAETIPATLSTIGRVMAERTTQSWTTVPHFFVARDVEAAALIAAHEQLAPDIERRSGVKATLTDLLIALVARALRKHPRMNASWTGAGITGHDEVNMGLAIAVNDGVVAAVIPKADAATLAEIGARRRDLAERAREGKLKPADITGATFTISNLGMFQVDAFTAIIVPPQAGILAVGAITNRVVALDDRSVGVRPMMTLTLSCDHRVVDGAKGALFLNDVVEAIRNPRRSLG